MEACDVCRVLTALSHRISWHWAYDDDDVGTFGGSEDGHGGLRQLLELTVADQDQLARDVVLPRDFLVVSHRSLHLSFVDCVIVELLQERDFLAVFVLKDSFNVAGKVACIGFVQFSASYTQVHDLRVGGPECLR